MIPTVLAAAARGAKFAQLDVQPWQWGLFVGLVVVLLTADLVIIHRDAHVITFKEAAIESAVWISIGLAFTGVVYAWHGAKPAGEYITGFLLEESLSIDNVLVWTVIFSYFAVPAKYQFRTLFWGIFGALVLRAIFIFAGIALIQRFDFVLVGFGLILLYSAWKIAFHDDQEIQPDKNPILRVVRKVVPSTTEYDGQKLFTVENSKRLATPLFAVLIIVETTDVVFAVDSVPAVLAVSHEQFIVFSSNAFAILGLRSLYFLLGGMQDRFRYLNVGLGVILAFVGTKMLASYFLDFEPPTWLSLVVIVVVLAVTVAASLLADRQDEEGADTKGDTDDGGAATGPDDVSNRRSDEDADEDADDASTDVVTSRDAPPTP